MGYASQSGRATTSTTNPRAFGVCQRCGIWYNRDRLSFQFDWRGAALLNTRILVCGPCTDTPQEQLRSIVVPADPTPVYWPSVEPFIDDETGDDPVIGAPTGLVQAAVMPLYGTQAYGVKLALLSVTANGSTSVAVTCSAAHGMSTDDQIAVEGLSNPLACGFFSVTVGSAMAFTYTCATAITAGALLTATTNMITALVGLPYDQTTIPQV